MLCATWIYVLIIFDVLVLLNSLKQWGDGNPLFPSHKIPDGALNPRRLIVRKKIVDYHNFFRSKVRPTASNMLYMKWDDKAAQQAQRYAEECRFLVHNDNSERMLPDRGICGQNLYVSSVKTPWFYALKTWFLEYKKFKYGVPVRNFTEVGHYTQMVWATTFEVGCGFANCSGAPWGNFYNYVCHYCPGGNIDSIVQFPYKVGEPCADCPNDCVGGTLCMNACPRRDYFTNCDELVGTIPGYCKEGYCNATCECGDKLIHKTYPF